MTEAGGKPGGIGSISAVFPAYNDAGTIASMVVAASAALRRLTDDSEIIVVNDGSTDHTAVVLEEMARRVPELRVITHETNQGYGTALRTGFAAAGKEWVFYTDGDAQYNPFELADLAAAVRPGVEVVNGYKIARSDPLVRIVIGRLYHHLARLMFGFRLRDVDCDFRLIRREIFERVRLESRSGTLPLEMVKKFQQAGYTFAEVPVHHYARQYGVSQFFNVRRLVRTGVQLAQLWWNLVVRPAWEGRRKGKDGWHEPTA
jgi:glycosyltransferase involved in cell wall biosynthesis